MKETLKKIFKSYIKTTGKNKFIFILFFGVFTALITVVEPLFFAAVIKKLEDFYETGIFNYNELIILIIYWILFIILTIVVSFYYRYNLVDKTILNNYLDLNRYYSKRLINMSYDDYLKKKQGSIYKNLDRGIMAQFNFLFFIFSDLIKNIFGIIFIIIILIYIDYKMAFLALLMLPVMIYAGYYFYSKLAPTQNDLNKKWDNIFGILGDFMTNLSLVKVLTLENYYKKIVNKNTDTLLNEQLKISKGWSISDIYTGILVMISRILVLGFGIYFVVNGSLSLAALFLFFSYIGWIYFPLSFLFSKGRQIQESLTALEKMQTEFDSLENDNDNSGNIIKKIKGNLEFQNVNFKYNNNKTIFNNLNFSINKGEKIAFVGNTGAGKSTIVNLILRFWDIDSGKILLDNIDTNTINKQSLRSNIGIVSQDNSLFNMTIKENLLFAKPNATKKELEVAIKKAEASFVFDLEKGIDTVIGERGLKLSGGEKQRLSIARLFLKNPKILILDEATSALDNKTEKMIQKALDKLMVGRTSIIIAHRLSTIQNADKIFMLENGEILESGNYNELMNKKEKFYSLANPEHLIIN